MSDPLQAALAKKRKRTPAHPTREQEPVHPPVHGEDADRPWLPPSRLAAPPERPGMAQRWVRVGIHGQDDPSNLAAALQEGWRPRRADTLPAGFAAPKIDHGEYAGVIGIHGMVLCEIPKARMQARARYYAEMTRKQTQAVEQGLARVSDPRLPLQRHRDTQVVKKRDPTIPAAAPDTDEG